QSALASTPVLIAAAIVAIYLILGMLYESTIHPITILSTLPSAGLGALLALWTFGFGLDVIGLIGILLLIGIVTKNGFMLIDYALDAERHRGVSAEQSALEACKVRFRPILMTTTCAMLGGVPLMIGTGTGSELRQPLGAQGLRCGRAGREPNTAQRLDFVLRCNRACSTPQNRL